MNASQISHQISHEDLSFLLEVSKLYYQEGKTQAAIGRRMETSRSTISRALQEARDLGLVEITIHYDWFHKSELEHTLKQSYNLKEVLILPTDNASGTNETIDNLGQLAAGYLEKNVKDNMILGMSYGRSVAATIKHIQADAKENLSVVQIIGALGSSNPLIEGSELSRDLASKYGGSYRYLYAPLVVEDKLKRDLFVEESLVQDVLSLGKQADILVTGIGSIQRHDTSLIWSGYLSEKDLDGFDTQGAVGYMCAQFFDNAGNLMDIPYNDRIIGIGLETLRDVDTVVAVAGGIDKSQAILGALRGGYIDVLVTDEAAAEEIMRHK